MLCYDTGQLYHSTIRHKDSSFKNVRVCEMRKFLAFYLIRCIYCKMPPYQCTIFNCTKKILKQSGSGVRLYDGPHLKPFILVGWDRSFLSVACPTGVQLVFFFCSGVSKLFGAQGSPSSGGLLNMWVLVFDSS